MANMGFVVNELNPTKDMNGVVKMAFKPLDPLNNFRESLETVLSRVYALAKPLVRGGVSGAGVGALVGFISGNDVGASASYGALIGGGIDSAQYYPRTIYYGVKSFFQ